MVKDRPLTFLAQFNCEELAQFDKEHLLPDHGLLSFFYETDTQCWGYDPNDKGCARVYWFEDMSALSAADFPADMGEDFKFPMVKIQIAQKTSYPSWTDFSEVFPDEKDYDAFDLVWNELTDETPENRSQLLLEQEKERTDFYAAQCGGIRFDHDLLAGSVTVYDYHAEPMQQKKVTDFAQGKGLSFLNEQDRRKLSKAISRATPEAPDVVLPVMVQRDGKPHLHRMALHTIWSGAGVRRCVNVLGHLTDEQHRVEHQAELLTAIDPEEDPARFLRRLQGIFDVVRLVDPEHRKVLALDSDGILTEKPGNCHMVWNKDTRCENCISAKAYARKTILNKIEFKDEEAYFVISKYIEVGGRGCMLELVTRLTDGRWLDMGGHRLLLDRCNGMERSAFVDPLTGAYTRRYFDKFLAGGEMHGGVAMIDVNQFKSVNDSFGHLVGDEALQTVAAAMQSCLRQTDILIRYGGDEFLLLMPQNCPDGVESVIRRVQNAVQAARVPSHPELRLSVSIGGVCNVQPLTEAIRQADARMYCNKENGEQVL